jgi:Fungal specific transcription factor domain
LSRLGIHCLYQSDSKENLGFSTDPDISELGKALSSHRHVAATSTRTAVPLPEMVSPFAFITSLPGCFEGPSLLGGELRLLDLDEQLTIQACEVMTRNGDDITSICDRYFKVTEKWLPIIDKTEFFVRLEQLQTSPSAPFSTLVMSMCLYAQQSSTILGRNSRVESLYYTTKCFYSLLQSSGRVSLELLQAGLLIATYEHSQALYEVSALSIGICARMGYALGLHRTIQPGTGSEDMPKKDLEESRRVWWGIFILER